MRGPIIGFRWDRSSLCPNGDLNRFGRSQDQPAQSGTMEQVATADAFSFFVRAETPEADRGFIAEAGSARNILRTHARHCQRITANSDEL